MARWLLLLGAVDRQHNETYEDIYKELEEIAMEDPILKEAFERWETLSADKASRARYEARLKQVLDEFSTVREAEIRQQRAKEEGIKIGIEQGIEQGLERANITTARNLLSLGIEDEVIIKATGLTLAQLNILRLNQNE